MRVILKSSLACPPYFGLAGDVLDLPDPIAEMCIKQETAEELAAFLKRKEDEKKSLNRPEPEADLLISGDKEEAERVEKNLAGIDELFEKQHGEVAEVEAEKKAKKK